MQPPDQHRASDWFYCTRFRLRNALSPQKVSTDGVLLGAWAAQGMRGEEPFRAADIGAGTGILSALLADRFPKATIDLFEWHPGACSDLHTSLAEGLFADRLSLFEGNWYDRLPEQKPPEGYALVVTNPPFWVEQRPSERVDRAQARHMESAAEWNRWLYNAAEAVAPGGRLSWVASAQCPLPESGVLPTDFGLLRRVWIRAKPGKPRIRRLEEWMRGGSGADRAPFASFEEVEWTLSEPDGSPNSDYKKLLTDFLPSLSSEGLTPPPISPNCSK
ncbi:methyltransferase [bacterium]|nr:methyltransferase [bacterium]